MWCSSVGGVVTLILSLLVAPLAVTAQPPSPVHRIGLLRTGSALSDRPSLESFRQGLRDLGRVPGPCG